MANNRSEYSTSTVVGNNQTFNFWSGPQRENQYGGQNPRWWPKWLPIVLNFRKKLFSLFSHILNDVNRNDIRKLGIISFLNIHVW